MDPFCVNLHAARAAHPRFNGVLPARPSHVEKHVERTQWLRDHLAEVLANYGLDVSNGNRWRVKPLIVLSHELMSPFIAPVAIESIPLRDLAATLVAG